MLFSQLAQIDLGGYSTGLMCFVGFIVVVAIAFIASAIRIVPEYQRLVVFRFDFPVRVGILKQFSQKPVHLTVDQCRRLGKLELPEIVKSDLHGLPLFFQRDDALIVKLDQTVQRTGDTLIRKTYGLGVLLIHLFKAPESMPK